MYLIKFPFKVKLGGEYYAAGEPVKVKNAEDYVAMGAVVIEQVAAAPKAKSAGRKPKKQPAPVEDSAPAEE